MKVVKHKYKAMKSNDSRNKLSESTADIGKHHISCMGNIESGREERFSFDSDTVDKTDNGSQIFLEKEMIKRHRALGRVKETVSRSSGKS